MDFDAEVDPSDQELTGSCIDLVGFGSSGREVSKRVGKQQAKVQEMKIHHPFQGFIIFCLGRTGGPRGSSGEGCSFF